MISIAPARMPAAITPETAVPACARRVEAGEQRPHALGPAQDAERDAGRDAERALGADQDAHQVEPVVVEPLPAEVHDVAVGEHDLEARHVRDGETVLEAVRAARVLGDVAADRADLLARRVGRVVEAVWRHGLGHREIRDPRLDDHPPALEIDLDDPVHPGERDDDSVRVRHGPAREAGTRAAGHERHAVIVAGADDGLHVAPSSAAAPPARERPCGR